MIGFDNLAINHQLLLSLPFDEMTGLVTHDVAKPHHELTLTGTPPTWNSLVTGFPYIDFDGAADFLQCPAADSDDLNFTTEEFSLLVWLYNTGPVGVDSVMCQGEDDVDGWELFIEADADIILRTNQGGAHTDLTATAGFTASAWSLIGVTRFGLGGQFYLNGELITTTGALTDPVSVAAGNIFYVGCQDGGIANFWDGYMALPRIWDRLVIASEMKAIFAMERHWFGV